MFDEWIMCNARLLKAGALINEMRILVRLWDDKKSTMSVSTLSSFRFLNKASRRREMDIISNAFIPRFVKGSPPQAWRIARALEDKGIPKEVLLPVYYWITVRNEPLVRDFLIEEIEPLYRTGCFSISSHETVKWLEDKLAKANITWSTSTIRGVAGKILVILRDFGILQGKTNKKIAHFYLPIASFAYIAFCLSKEIPSTVRLLNHPDWKLFFLTPSDTEQMFLEADRQKLLTYLVAGRIQRIEFPANTYEGMADVVANRTS